MQRNTRRTALLLAVTLSAGTALALGPAWTTTARQDPAGEREEHHEETPLSAAMEHMNASLRKLRRALKASDGAAALAALPEFQQYLVVAKSETPPSAAEVPEFERPAYLNDFRAMLVDVLRATCDLETALIEERLDDADTILRERLHSMKDAGHERFGGEDD